MRIAEFVTPVVRQHRYRERERSKRRRPNEGIRQILHGHPPFRSTAMIQA
jgi:hypothetical protein